MLDAGNDLDPAHPAVDAQAAIEAWSESNAESLERALGMVAEIRASRIYDNTTLPVALREIRSLLRGTSRTGGPSGRSRWPSRRQRSGARRRAARHRA